MHLTAGGNNQSEWICIPTSVRSYSDIVSVLNQVRPIQRTYERAAIFGITRERLDAMREELNGYAFGMMLGDSGKEGGQADRFTSANLDLNFSMKHPSNQNLGEFTCMCLNSLGLEMERIKDKAPTGDTLKAEDPSEAFRWTSERSPLLAWMSYEGMGIGQGKTTSRDPVRMDWVMDAPFNFRKRFAQGIADSDGSVKDVIVITSAPNSEFLVKLLHSLEIKSAHVVYEGGIPLRVTMNGKEAAGLPIFNEIVKGYRFKKMSRWAAT